MKRSTWLKLTIFLLIVVGYPTWSAYHQKKLIQEDIALIRKTYPKALSVRYMKIPEEDETYDADIIDELSWTVESWFHHYKTYETYFPLKDKPGYVGQCIFKVIDGRVQKYMYDADISFN